MPKSVVNVIKEVDSAYNSEDQNNQEGFIALNIASRVNTTASIIVNWNSVFSTPLRVRKDAWPEPKNPDPCPLI